MPDRMKVSGAVAMADYVEAFGLTEREVTEAKAPNQPPKGGTSMRNENGTSTEPPSL